MILDTNALSAIAEGHPAVARILASARRLAVPVVAIGEYRYGIAQSRYTARYRSWLDGLIGETIVLDVTEQTSHHYAAIHIELKQRGTPIPTNDLWIAALCRQHSLPILSRDRHFDVVFGIQRIDW